MKPKEFLILFKALLPAIISLLLVVGTAIYFQHQTNVSRQECVDNGEIFFTKEMIADTLFILEK